MAKKVSEVENTEEVVKPVKKTTTKKTEKVEENVKPAKKTTTKKVETVEAEKTVKKTATKTVKKEEKPAKKVTKKEEVKTGKTTIKSYECIIRPILSEETMKNMETKNKITVQVNKNSNKVEIKNAFEAIFGVKVKQINVSNVRAKDKRVGKYSGKTSSYKKAVVTLAEGQSLDLLKK